MNQNNISQEEAYHNRIAEKYCKIREHDYIWEIPEEMFILKKIYFKNKVVIDVGCGPAVSIKNIIDERVLLQSSYIGVDISRRMLKLAKKNIPSGKFYHLDISKLFFQKEVADTLLSLGALHHVKNPKKTIINWIRIIKPSGYLLLREPTLEALKRGYGASPDEEGIPIDDIITILKENNFVIHRTIYFTSKLFHFINKIFIKLFGKIWQESKIMWYPIMIIDICVSNVFGKYINFFRGEACIIIAQKI